jgi:hypothetical protein
MEQASRASKRTHALTWDVRMSRTDRRREAALQHASRSVVCGANLVALTSSTCSVHLHDPFLDKNGGGGVWESLCGVATRCWSEVSAKLSESDTPSRLIFSPSSSSVHVGYPLLSFVLRMCVTARTAGSAARLRGLDNIRRVTWDIAYMLDLR